MRTRLVILFSALLPTVAFAQETKQESHTYMSNGVFLTLAAVILLLAIVIVGMAEMVKASAKVQRNREKNNPPKLPSMLLFLLLVPAFANAQDAAAAATTGTAPVPEVPFDYWGLGAQMFFVMIAVIVFELLIIYVLFRTGLSLLKIGMEPEPTRVETFMESKLMKSITGNQTPEEEQAIMMDHEYDGIRELDNNLPLWWKYGFYLTIVVSVIYLFNYHILETGLSSSEEYQAEVEKAEAEIAEYKRNNANNVDENSVTQLIDAASLAAGKSIFIQNCAACHGPEGQGTVGPNLTDDYWLHKGGIVDVFKSVKYGWTDKGMKSWEQDLKPLEMQQVSSYILSLRGTNPANAKAKEGELYVDEAGGADSLGGDSARADSLAVDSMPKTDTVKK